MSFALAFACDDCAESEAKPRWLSAAEGAGLALLLSMTGLFVLRWQQSALTMAAPGIPRPGTWRRC